MKEEQKNLIKITYTTDRTAGTTRVGLKPKLDKDNVVDYIECLVSGTYYGLLTLLDGFPLIRPATKEERDAHCYIFKDGKDEKTFQNRKAIYDTLVSVFEKVLSDSFPDVEYVKQCQTYTQNLVVDASPEEVEEHRALVAALAESIRSGGENDGPVQ